eukprot:6700064-Pyramimonas_sp.AAC.1
MAKQLERRLFTHSPYKAELAGAAQFKAVVECGFQVLRLSSRAPASDVEGEDRAEEKLWLRVSGTRSGAHGTYWLLDGPQDDAPPAPIFVSPRVVGGEPLIKTTFQLCMDVLDHNQRW